MNRGIHMTHENMRPEVTALLKKAAQNHGQIETEIWIELSAIAKCNGLDEFYDFIEKEIAFGEIPLDSPGYTIVGHDEKKVKLKINASVDAEFFDEVQIVEEVGRQLSTYGNLDIDIQVDVSSMISANGTDGFKSILLDLAGIKELVKLENVSYEIKTINAETAICRLFASL